MHRVSWNSLPDISDAPSCPLRKGFLNYLPCFSAPLHDVLLSQLPLPLLRTDPCRLLHVCCLGLGTLERFLSSKQQGDLEQSILSFTEAIFLSPARETPPSLNIVRIFHSLALCFFFRVKKSRRPEDVKCCVKYLRYLHGQWHELTTFLVHALAMQVELELGDVDEDIEEMANLCGELLNSDISIESLTDPIADFARVIDLHFNDPPGPESKILSEKAIDCLRNAIVRLPGLHQVSFVLARSLYNRFDVAHSTDDYEEGIRILDRLITFRGSGDGPSPYREDALGLAAFFADTRFTAYGKPEYLEHAIYRYRAFLDGTSIEDPNRAKITGLLSYFEALRLDGKANALDALSIAFESARPPLFRDLISDFPETMAVEPYPIEAFTKHIHALGASYY